jgi:hypothetical protein
MSLATDLSNGRVYCTNVNARKVDVIDARADTLIKTIPLGQALCRMCHNRINSRVYITDETGNVVYVIRDTASGLSEEPRSGRAYRPRPTTIVRDDYYCLERVSCALVDACGRNVLRLHQGKNDLSNLAPGVYFVREEAQAQAQAVTKVVLTR